MESLETELSGRKPREAEEFQESQYQKLHGPYISVSKDLLGPFLEKRARV